MLQLVLTQLLKLIAPKAKPWVIALIAGLIPEAIALVERIAKSKGDVDVVIQGTADLLDNALDGIPEWKALSEEERDSIIVGVANLAKFMADVSAKPGGKKAVKLAVKGARRAK